MSSSNGMSPPQRPDIRARQSSSFHARALAVSAAHRLASSRSPEPTSATASPLLLPGSAAPPGTQAPFQPQSLSPPKGNPSTLSSVPLSPAKTNGTTSSGSSIDVDIEAGVAGRGAGRHETTGHGVHFHTRSPRSPASPRAKGNGRRSMSSSTGASGDARQRYQWVSAGGGGTGDEPGVDVRSRRDEEAYSHLKGKTHIAVVDYSSNPDEDKSNIKCEFDGEQLKEFLEGMYRPADDEGKPLGVRWIHVDGLNWEVIKTLTLHFGLHPLAVEDALRSANSPRSKLDFYRNHLYLQIFAQHMHSQDEVALSIAAEALEEGHVDEVLPGTEEGEEGARRLGGRMRSMSLVAQGHQSGIASKRGRGGALKGLRDVFGGSRRMMRLPEGVEGVFEPSMGGTRLQGGTSPYQKAAHRLTVDQLSAKYMVPIRRGILSVFMTRDGTLITMSKHAVPEVINPIYERLEDEQSLLRRSGDVSMLAEALLDVTADLAIEIMQTFEAEILQLEASVLVDPQMETVRHLHVLSSQLIRLRRSLTPLLHVCYILRDQDTQRSAAASALAIGPKPHEKNQMSREGSFERGREHRGMTSAGGTGPGGTGSGLAGHGAPGGGSGITPPNFDAQSIKSFLQPLVSGQTGTGSVGTMAALGGGSQLGPPAAQGFFSSMTKVYIGDVLDHLEIIVSNLDQFVATCDHLTDYVFNVLSFQTNASMERLSIVTVVFLPLTFIASYFGMNFTGFDQLQGPVSYFWKVAVPCTTAFFVIFSFSYLRSATETVGRRLARWRRTRELEQRARGTVKRH